MEIAGRYKVIEKIGEGGSGVVYKVVDKQLDRVLALKILTTGDTENQKNSERFLREAKTMAGLSHPNIVAVHDIGIHEDRHFFTMDFVDGCSLDTLIRQSHIPSRQAACIMTKVAQALQYAHDEGVIHRDLKPSNILIDKHNEPKVMDFGLAKIKRANKKLSKTGMVLGTLQYIPPEQAQGLLEAIDARSDVYSMGAVLYEILVGKPPFTGTSSFDIINKILTIYPLNPSRVNARVPDDIGNICMKALEKQKERRYQTAKEFGDDLFRFLDGRAVLASSPSFLLHFCDKIRPYRNVIFINTSIFFISVLLVSYFAFTHKGKDTSQESNKQEAKESNIVPPIPVKKENTKKIIWAGVYFKNRKIVYVGEYPKKTELRGMNAGIHQVMDYCFTMGNNGIIGFTFSIQERPVKISIVLSHKQSRTKTMIMDASVDIQINKTLIKSNYKPINPEGDWVEDIFEIDPKCLSIPVNEIFIKLCDKSQTCYLLQSLNIIIEK